MRQIKMEQKKTNRQVIADRLFCHEIFWGEPPMTKGFRHLGKVPVKGCGLTAAAGLYQRIELFDNAKALRVLRILVVPLIVKIFLNDFVDDLVDPVCEGILTLRDTDSCSLCFRINFEIQVRDDHKIAVRVGFQI